MALDYHLILFACCRGLTRKKAKECLSISAAMSLPSSSSTSTSRRGELLPSIACGESPSKDNGYRVYSYFAIFSRCRKTTAVVWHADERGGARLVLAYKPTARNRADVAHTPQNTRQAPELGSEPSLCDSFCAHNASRRSSVVQRKGILRHFPKCSSVSLPNPYSYLVPSTSSHPPSSHSRLHKGTDIGFNFYTLVPQPYTPCRHPTTYSDTRP